MRKLESLPTVTYKRTIKSTLIHKGRVMCRSGIYYLVYDLTELEVYYVSKERVIEWL